MLCIIIILLYVVWTMFVLLYWKLLTNSLSVQTHLAIKLFWFWLLGLFYFWITLSLLLL